MHYGCRWLIFRVVLSMILVFSTFRTSSKAGSSLPSPVPSPGSHGCYLNDRCTLLTFKNRLLNEGEPALVSWSSADVSHWKGVTWKTGVTGSLYVEKLELGEFKLNGTSLAPLLQVGLTNLTTLNISGNFISATLPDPLRICPALLVLDISNNSFFGNLPHVLSCDDTENSSAPLDLVTLTSMNLRVLNLSHNHFSGDVPSSLFSPLSSGVTGGSLSNLTSLILEDNAFEGSFPSSISNCTDLVELKVLYNGFSGTFPFDALQKLEKLEILDATSNNITGNLQIPIIDGGSLGRLKSLRLGHNYLTGNIPESFGNLSNLETLDLKYNNLSGSIPKTLAKLAKLEILSLQRNYLSGTIPEEFSQLSNLATLSLNHNRLRGSLPPYLSDCTNLKSIWLSQNFLSGAIPSDLGNLPNLVVLSLSGNYFNQSIPAELGRLKNLVALDISYNSLGGNIPDGLCDLFQLQILFLNNNRLTGFIPNCFGNYTYLHLLDLSSNFLTGNFPNNLSNLSLNVQSLSKAPDELSSATYIQELDGQNLVYQFSQSPIAYSFARNFLSGPIPTTFGSIQNMQQLRLNGNNLYGPIPEALGNASALLVLDLSFNNLTGLIPFSLTELHFLSQLNFSYNNLSGEIPQDSQFLTFGKDSFYGNQFLCGFPLERCSSPQREPPSFGPSSMLTDESPFEKWVSFSAFGVGVAIGFVVVSSFSFPFAYLSGKRAKADRIVPVRHEQYGAFRNPL